MGRDEHRPTSAEANPAERVSRIPQQVDALKLVRSSSDISIGTL
jgi:hypothetical protein